MSTTVKTGWLHDKNGDKFAPKTLTSQVQTSDGILLEDKIQADLDTALKGKADLAHSHSIGDISTGKIPFEVLKGMTAEAVLMSVDEEILMLQEELDKKAGKTHTHAISDVTGLQAALDGKAEKSHTHTVSEISDLTATAAELNYVSGVTSSIQTQLNAKVPTTRTINGKNLSANITLTAGDLSAYTKTEIDNMELITIDDIDTICGGTIQVTSISDSEVTF